MNRINPKFARFSTKMRPVFFLITVAGMLVGAGSIQLMPAAAQIPSADCSVTSLGLTPLSDMTATDSYYGEEGGLYGQGKNLLELKSPHGMRAYEATQAIQPRGPGGAVDPVSGRIGFISIGMSNAKMEYDAFSALVKPGIPSDLVLVNGAQPGKLAVDWAYPVPDGDPWELLALKIQNANLTPAQIQVVWLKEANSNPQKGFDDFPVYAEKLRDDMAVIVQQVKELYPNVQVVYLSSRIYAGYSVIGLSPEPFAYEGVYSVRWLIEDQMNGGGASGVTYQNAPVLLWGPYMWADGVRERNDGLSWNCDDFIEDGVHPSDAGELKAAKFMLDFFESDPLARSWFVPGDDLPPVPGEITEVFLPLLVKLAIATEAYPPPMSEP